MNRGAHEGESGVALYYFDASVSSVEECLFVDTKQNYELLKKDVDSVSYVSSDRNRFYLCVEGSIYGITLDTRQINTVAENLRSDCYVSSSSGRYLAWLQQNEPYNSNKITVLDFDTMTTKEISCGDSERICHAVNQVFTHVSQWTDALTSIGIHGEDLFTAWPDAADISTEHEGMKSSP